MKKFYFSKNVLTGEIYLDSGRFGKRRVYVSSREPDFLIKELKEYLNPKRKSIFYVSSNVEDNLISKLEKFFEGSKILLKKVKNLEDY